MLGKPAEERGEPLPCVSVGTRVRGAAPRPRGVLPGDAASRPGAIPSSFPVPGAAPASARAALRPGPGAWTGQRGTGRFCAASPEAQLRQLGGSQPLAACLRYASSNLMTILVRILRTTVKPLQNAPACTSTCRMTCAKHGPVKSAAMTLSAICTYAAPSAPPILRTATYRPVQPQKPQAEAPGQTWAGI